MSEKNWYAVYTRVRWEKKVAELLTKNKIENYCPVNRTQRQWADRKKIVNEPLFTSYVFVRTTEQEHNSLKRIDGVINLVYWLGKPAIIRDAEIEVIREFLNDYSNVKLEKTAVSINDRVRIISGPFVNQEGQVVSVKNKTVKIILPSLGFIMSAEVAAGNIEIIHQRTRFLEESGFGVV